MVYYSIKTCDKSRDRPGHQRFRSTIWGFACVVIPATGRVVIGSLALLWVLVFTTACTAAQAVI